MYDPVVGRFLGDDPLGAAGGDPNLYRYAANAPTNATDPSGLQAAGVGATPLGSASTPSTPVMTNAVFRPGVDDPVLSDLLFRPGDYLSAGTFEQLAGAPPQPAPGAQPPPRDPTFAGPGELTAQGTLDAWLGQHLDFQEQLVKLALDDPGQFAAMYQALVGAYRPDASYRENAGRLMGIWDTVFPVPQPYIPDTAPPPRPAVPVAPGPRERPDPPPPSDIAEVALDLVLPPPDAAAVPPRPAPPPAGSGAGRTPPPGELLGGLAGLLGLDRLGEMTPVEAATLLAGHGSFVFPLFAIGEVTGELLQGRKTEAAIAAVGLLPFGKPIGKVIKWFGGTGREAVEFVITPGKLQNELVDGVERMARKKPTPTPAAPGAKPPLRYQLGPNDLDWRGTGKTHLDALDEAFRRTGRPKEEFEVTKWGKDAYGKSHPVEWRHKDGSEVNIDWPHVKHGPDAPHVGWQTGGKRSSGGAQRGHILLEEVPYNRSSIKEQVVTGNIAAEIKRAASEVGVELTEMSDADRHQLRRILLQYYTDGLEQWPSWIWEHVRNEYATRCPDGWRAVGDFTPDRSVTLLFNPSEDDSMLTFRSGEDVVRVLTECYGFEVYFTDQHASFLLIHNHHDCLIACGTAKPWVQDQYPLIPC